MNYAEMVNRWIKGDTGYVISHAYNMNVRQLLELATCMVTHPKVGVDALHILGRLLEAEGNKRYENEQRKFQSREIRRNNSDKQPANGVKSGRSMV